MGDIINRLEQLENGGDMNEYKFLSVN